MSTNDTKCDVHELRGSTLSKCFHFLGCRGMRGDQARKVCPEVQLVQVPTAHGKADLTLYRDAGKQVGLHSAVMLIYSFQLHGLPVYTMLLICSFRAPTTCYIAACCCCMHATFTCSCIELHMLATDQEFTPATLKANIRHPISIHHHKMPLVS